MIRTIKSIALCTIILFLKVPIHAQSIQLSIPKMENVTLKTFIGTIEKKTDYTFMLSNAVDQNSHITIKAQKAALDAILKEAFSNTDISYEFVGKQILLKKKQVGKSSGISGIIIDESGESLIGANVQVKGSKVGTITDVNGKFSVPAALDDVLKISYIGYQSIEVPIKGQSHINITLKGDNKILDEVVVVGYGTQRKVNLTGSVSHISAEQFKDRPITNVSQALQGIAPGLNIHFSSGKPGETASYNIRGNTSPNGGSPLILVDGVETYPERINANDIETITVLKDAASAAIYGARASFGVILITTKSGKTGERPTVSYSGRHSWGKPTTSTDFETRGYYSAKTNDLFLIEQTGLPYTKYTEEDYAQLWARRDDKTEHPDRPWVMIDQRDGRDTYVYYANFDWYNHMIDDKRPSWEHNVNIKGGTDKFSYMISGQYLTQDGIMRQNTDQYKQYNFRTKLTAQLKPWLRISNNTKFYRSQYDYPGLEEGNNWRSMQLHALASFIPTNPDGTSVHTTSLTNGYQIMDGFSAMMNKGKSEGTNTTQEITTTFDVNLKLHNDFSINADFSYRQGLLRKKYRSTNVEYSKYPGVVSTLIDKVFEDKLKETVWDQNYYTTNVYGNYTKTVAKDHHIGVVVGYNYEARHYIDLFSEKKKLLSEDLSDLDVATGEMTVTGGQTEYAIMGWFYRATYDYQGKYLFEADGRYDGTSRFKRGHRYGFFPSFSLGYRISEEEFFKPLRSVIDNLKLRFSYGSLGNQQIGYYDFMQSINTSNKLSYTFDGLAGLQYASVSAPVASNKSWEKIVHKNLGLDLTLLNNRLNLTLDGYFRDTKGILGAGKDLPQTYGATKPMVNANDMRTKGYEIALSWNDRFSMLGKPFRYGISVTLSDYVAEYTKCDNPTGKLNEPYKGKKLGEIWGYRTGGLFKSDEEAAAYGNAVNLSNIGNFYNAQNPKNYGPKAGDLMFLDTDGNHRFDNGLGTLTDHGDMVIIGNSQPRYSYGITLNADWYGVDVSAFFQGVGKRDWYPGGDNIRFWGPYIRPYATFLPTDFMDNVWSESNPNAYFPRPRAYAAYGGSDSSNELRFMNDRYLQDVGYCRLKNFTIGYTFPKSIMQKLRVQNLRIYFSGENLLTWSRVKSKYVDPEECAASDSQISDAFVYPWNKTFSFGIDLTF